MKVFSRLYFIPGCLFSFQTPVEAVEHFNIKMLFAFFAVEFQLSVNILTDLGSVISNNLARVKSIPLPLPDNPASVVHCSIPALTGSPTPHMLPGLFLDCL